MMEMIIKNEFIMNLISKKLNKKLKEKFNTTLELDIQAVEAHVVDNKVYFTISTKGNVMLNDIAGLVGGAV